MKKLLASILLLVYFTVSTGFVVSFHYCMDKINSVQIGHKQSDRCDKCGMHKQKKGCCHDEVKVVKMQVSHVASSFIAFHAAVPQAETVQHFFDPAYIQLQTTALLPHNTGPPRSGKETCIENSIFRI